MKHKKATIKKIKSNLYLYSYSYIPVKSRRKKERRFEWRYRGPFQSHRASMFMRQLSRTDRNRLEADYIRRKKILSEGGYLYEGFSLLGYRGCQG